MGSIDKIKKEQRAFDMQIEDRIRNGYVPDLRRAKKCNYFYNNSWRHPDYVELDFKEQFNVICSAICDFIRVRGRKRKILEVGCGPGHLSLELARSGFDVNGIDVSLKCIEVAEQVASSDPWKKSRGTLVYEAVDFFSFAKMHPSAFDAVVFLGALHHFKDQSRVMRLVLRVLKPGGIIVVHEPTRDRVTEGHAVFLHMLHVLLSLAKGFYQEVPVPKDHKAYKKSISELFQFLRYEDVKGRKVQSVNDNEAGFRKIFKALDKNFQKLHYKERAAFFHELIGGLRFKNQTNKELALYLRDVDRYLCELGVLQSTEFFFVGRKKT